MGNKNMKFTNQHAIQYTNISSDLRFYAEQRFKIAGVFMITNGILANIASERHNILLGLIGIALGYLCLSWEKRTTAWWAILFEGLKTLEKRAKDAEVMIEVYRKYPRKSAWPFVKATHAVEGIYYLAIGAWSLFAIYSWSSLW